MRMPLGNTDWLALLTVNHSATQRAAWSIITRYRVFAYEVRGAGGPTIAASSVADPSVIHGVSRSTVLDVFSPSEEKAGQTADLPFARGRFTPPAAPSGASGIILTICSSKYRQRRVINASVLRTDARLVRVRTG